MREINEQNSDLYLDKLESMDYENDKTIISSFWIEKKRDHTRKTRNVCNKAECAIMQKSQLNKMGLLKDHVISSPNCDGGK